MRLWVMMIIALLVTGCTIVRQTEPKRTATEEMLISAAGDGAASQIHLATLHGKKVFVDASHYKGLDPDYTMAAVHEALLKNGALLVGDRKSADAVVVMRNGAQSIDKREFLIGIPSFSLPIPLTGAPYQTQPTTQTGATGGGFQVPEIALYAKAQNIGVSKLAVAAYNAKSGALVSSSGPVYGFSHGNRYTVLIFVKWRHRDFRPSEQGLTGKGK
ncbi:MAG: DUF6655 family protein [Acetobacteraceae bacterium]